LPLLLKNAINYQKVPKTTPNYPKVGKKAFWIISETAWASMKD
jgi:hypothetical protein